MSLETILVCRNSHSADLTAANPFLQWLNKGVRGLLYNGINCPQVGRVLILLKEAHRQLFLTLLSAICNVFLRMRSRKCVKMRVEFVCYQFLQPEK